MSELSLSTNVHEGIPLREHHKSYLVFGKYEYYHYLCDGFDDRGWGCGYRTLQTICSWMTHNHETKKGVPSIRDIQELLVQMEDKPDSFLGSKQWIGTFEVFLILDKLYNVPCKIEHVYKGDELFNTAFRLAKHFEEFGSPVMMGGDVDCSSKGIMGVDITGKDPRFLVVDPHYVGKEESNSFLQNKGWVKWQHFNDFLSSSFYNLCLPQVKSKFKTE